MNDQQRAALKLLIGNKLTGSLKQLQREGAATSYANGVMDGAEWMEAKQWIPVSERLPEKGVMVLIAEPAGLEYEYYVSYWDGTYSAKRFGSNPQFPDGQDEQPGYFWPSHWMPLPSPPKTTDNATEES